ncbi:hypothetical protein [Variovorax sp. Root318D1]|nr:hypothetical protein [Variovorax sp. Root318D1]
MKRFHVHLNVHGEKRALAGSESACCAPRSNTVTIHSRIPNMAKAKGAAQ